MEHSLIYITAASRDEAVMLGRSLVEARLVACANVIDGAISIYWWEGAVQEEREALLVAKTVSGNADAVIAKVKELHSYSCPCVVAMPIAAGNAAYLEWIERETEPRR